MPKNTPKELLLIKEALRWYLFRDRRSINNFACGINNEYLLRLGEIHGIDSQLALFFEEHSPGNVLTATFLERRKAIAAHNLKLQWQLERICACLSKNEIPFRILKGIPLVNRLYPSLADRPIGDIDLLVSRDEASRLDSALQALGFRPISPLSSSQRDLLSRSFYAQGYSDLGGVMLDIHIGSAASFSFTLPLPVGPLSSGECSDSCAPDNLVTSAQDLFCFLCDHGTKHMWHRLIWLLDLALLLKDSGSINPQSLTAYFANNRCRRPLNFVLKLLSAYDLLPVEYQDQNLCESSIRGVTRVIERHSRVASRSELVPRNLLLHLSLIEAPAGKMKYLMRRILVLSPQDLSLFNFPRPLFGLYNLIRIVRLAGIRLMRILTPLRLWRYFTGTTT